jgi:hypothetical protein
MIHAAFSICYHHEVFFCLVFFFIPFHSHLLHRVSLECFYSLTRKFGSLHTHVDEGLSGREVRGWVVTWTWLKSLLNLRTCGDVDVRITAKTLIVSSYALGRAQGIPSRSCPVSFFIDIVLEMAVW